MGLRPPPASLDIPLYSFQFGKNGYFAAQLLGFHQIHSLLSPLLFCKRPNVFRHLSQS